MRSSIAETVKLYCKLKKNTGKVVGREGEREKTYPSVSASNKKSEMFSLNEPAGSFWIKKKYQKQDVSRPNKHVVNVQYLFLYA